MADFRSDESAFNFAVAYLKRVNELLYIAAESKGQRDLRRWFDVIRVIFGEVNIKFKPEEIKAIQEQEETIKKEFREKPDINLGDYKEVIVKGKGVKIPNCPLEREKLFIMIENYEYTIKKLADRYGMLLPSKSDPRFAILER